MQDSPTCPRIPQLWHSTIWLLTMKLPSLCDRSNHTTWITHHPAKINDEPSTRKTTQQPLFFLRLLLGLFSSSSRMLISMTPSPSSSRRSKGSSKYIIQIYLGFSERNCVPGFLHV